MTEEAGARLREAYATPLNASTQGSIEAGIRQRELDSHGQNLTPRERLGLGEQIERRQLLVLQHHAAPIYDNDTTGHAGGHKAAGCPYCYPPGVGGDYMPPAPVSAILAARAASAYRAAADDELPS